jgi:hypothetical protein
LSIFFYTPKVRYKIHLLFFKFIYNILVGILSQTTPQVLTSPGYPSNYPPFFFNIYNLTVSEGKVMQINFTDFKLDVECWYAGLYGDWYDHVKIVDANGDILLPNTCSDNMPAPMISKSNKVEVHFQTDGLLEDRGWRLIYSEL